MSIKQFTILVSVIILYLLFLIPSEVDAAIIVQAPKYVGLNSGLVGYWSFDGKDVVNTTAYDKSGNSNNGTLTNGPTRVAGKLGQALNFDGVNDYVAVTDASSLSGSNVKAVSFWFKRNSLTTNLPRLLEESSSADQNNYWSISTPQTGNADENALEVTVVVGGVSSNVKTPNNSVNQANVWYHAIITWNGASVSAIYLNGVSQTLSAPLGLTGGGVVRMTIGNRGDNSRPFDGQIDDVRIYNRALSTDEIKRLYKIGSALKINTTISNDSLKSGLIGYWTFDGADVVNTTAYDKSGNSNTGTLTNGPIREQGKIGQALSFDGCSGCAGDDLVNAGSNSVLDNLSDFSYSVWVYPKSIGEGNSGVVIFKRGANVGWALAYQNQNGALQFTVDYATTDLVQRTGNQILNINAWNHIVVTFSSSTSQTLAANTHIYVNGSEVSYSSSQNAVGARVDDSAANLILGATFNSNGTWDGLIDDVRLYNRILTKDEIKRLNKIGSATKISSTISNDSLKNGLVGHWTFDGADVVNTTAYDKSASNINGILTNGPIRTQGKIGQALSLDGIDDYISMGNLAPNTNSFSFWVKMATSTTGKLIDVSATRNIFLSNGVITTTAFASPSIYVDGVSGSSITDTNWHHVVVTTGTSITASAFEVGRSGANTSLGGIIDDVRVYSRVLTNEEIKRLYKSGQ